MRSPLVRADTPVGPTDPFRSLGLPLLLVLQLPLQIRHFLSQAVNVRRRRASAKRERHQHKRCS